MAHKNLQQSPLPKLKKKVSWKTVADIDKSTVAFRDGDGGSDFDEYQSVSRPMKAHHVSGEEWETGVVGAQDIHSDRLGMTWPTRVRPIRFGS